MLGFVLGDMYCQTSGQRLPPRLGKSFPIPADYRLRGRVSAAIMTIESLLDTPYPQKQFRDLVFGAFIERQRRLFGEHVIVARMEGEEGLELSIDLSFVSTAVPVGLLAISEELALATAPRPKKSHPHYEALCKAIDCMVMLMFYGKVIRQRNTVLENIGHQFGYQPAATLTARVGKVGEDDYDAFMVNIMTCIAHSNSLKEALENAIDNATNNGVVGNGNGSFPYTAGVRFTYQADRPKGQRITRLEWEAAPGQWQAVNAEQVYRGVSSAYTASGKEGYTALARTLTQHNQELGITLADAFIRWARHLPTLEAQPPLLEYFS